MLFYAERPKRITLSRFVTDKEPDGSTGNVFRSMRVAMGISLRLAASVIGCSVVELSDIERSQVALSPDGWSRIVSLLEWHKKDVAKFDKSAVLFFGCNIGCVVHHLWNGGDLVRPNANGCPWGIKDDSERSLDPSTMPSLRQKGTRGPASMVWMGDDIQTEGAAVLSTFEGWTRLGWPDRSLDTRLGSHANILASGIYSFDEMMSIARSRYLHVMSRIKYDITLCSTHTL